MRYKRSCPRSLRTPSGRGFSRSISIATATRRLILSSKERNSFAAEETNSTLYITSLSLLFHHLSLQFFPRYGRLTSPGFGNKDIVNILPEFSPFFQVDKDRRLLAGIVYHELNALHSSPPSPGSFFHLPRTSSLLHSLSSMYLLRASLKSSLLVLPSFPH